jgi:hypothetical protein
VIVLYNVLDRARAGVECVPLAPAIDAHAMVTRTTAAGVQEVIEAQWVPDLVMSDSPFSTFDSFPVHSQLYTQETTNLEYDFAWNPPPPPRASASRSRFGQCTTSARLCFAVQVPALGTARYTISFVNQTVAAASSKTHGSSIAVHSSTQPTYSDCFMQLLASTGSDVAWQPSSAITAAATVWVHGSTMSAGLCSHLGGMLCAVRNRTSGITRRVVQSFGVYQSRWSGAYLLRTELGLEFAKGFGAALGVLALLLLSARVSFRCATWLTGIYWIPCFMMPKALPDSAPYPYASSSPPDGSRMRVRDRMVKSLVPAVWHGSIALLAAFLFVGGVRAESVGGLEWGFAAAILYLVTLAMYQRSVAHRRSFVAAFLIHTFFALFGVSVALWLLRAYHLYPVSMRDSPFAVVRGSLVQEVASIAMGYPIATVLRLTTPPPPSAEDRESLQEQGLEFTVHGRALPAQELVLRFEADLSRSAAVSNPWVSALQMPGVSALSPPLNTLLYTDSGTRTHVLRSPRFRTISPIASNFFPMQSHSHLESAEGVGMSLTSAQSVSVSSLRSGQLDVLVHRFPVRDDGLGLSTGVDDVRPATLRLWLQLEEQVQSAWQHRQRSAALNRPFLRLFETSPPPHNRRTPSPPNGELPSGVHLLALMPLTASHAAMLGITPPPNVAIRIVVGDVACVTWSLILPSLYALLNARPDSAPRALTISLTSVTDEYDPSACLQSPAIHTLALRLVPSAPFQS